MFESAWALLDVGRVHCGFLVLPEGQEGQGWKGCVLELWKTVTFFEVSFGGGQRGVTSAQLAITDGKGVLP